jgi:hypothetical protein
VTTGLPSNLWCRGWQQEAALRTFGEQPYPDVAERPNDLVVYGGIGKAARDQRSLGAIKRELTMLGDEETLQSGKPVLLRSWHRRSSSSPQDEIRLSRHRVVSITVNRWRETGAEVERDRPAVSVTSTSTSAALALIECLV